MARESILKNQRASQKFEGGEKQYNLDIGTVVYAYKHYVNDPNYKIKPKFYGPLRIVKIQKNVAILRDFASGKYTQVSLRHVKLVPHSHLTVKDHANIGEPFATKGDGSLLPGEGITIIKKYDQLVTDNDKWDEDVGTKLLQPKDIDTGPETSENSEFSKLSGGGGPHPAEEAGSETEAPLPESKKLSSPVGQARKGGRPRGSKNKIHTGKPNTVASRTRAGTRKSTPKH